MPQTQPNHWQQEFLDRLGRATFATRLQRDDRRPADVSVVVVGGDDHAAVDVDSLAETLATQAKHTLHALVLHGRVCRNALRCVCVCPSVTLCLCVSVSLCLCVCTVRRRCCDAACALSMLRCCLCPDVISLRPSLCAAVL
jgi:hypothetical protein